MSWPRHHRVACSAACGYIGMRTSDAPADATRAPCPRCGAATELLAGLPAVNEDALTVTMLDGDLAERTGRMIDALPVDEGLVGRVVFLTQRDPRTGERGGVAVHEVASGVSLERSPKGVSMDYQAHVAVRLKAAARKPGALIEVVPGSRALQLQYRATEAGDRWLRKLIGDQGELPAGVLELGAGSLVDAPVVDGKRNVVGRVVAAEVRPALGSGEEGR